ncbi:hypothetical protein SAMN04487983_102941 [Streptomyces sp. yr375]|nr:hypothetical protein SAMN04487983_102941 [Streptomyces sp. yr375]
MAIRRAIGRRPPPTPTDREPPTDGEAQAATTPRSPEATTARAALDAISLQLDTLTELFGHPPTERGGARAPATQAAP